MLIFLLLSISLTSPSVMESPMEGTLITLLANPDVGSYWIIERA